MVWGALLGHMKVQCVPSVADPCSGCTCLIVLPPCLLCSAMQQCVSGCAAVWPASVGRCEEAKCL